MRDKLVRVQVNSREDDTVSYRGLSDPSCHKTDPEESKKYNRLNEPGRLNRPTLSSDVAVRLKEETHLRVMDNVDDTLNAVEVVERRRKGGIPPAHLIHYAHKNAYVKEHKRGFDSHLNPSPSRLVLQIHLFRTAIRISVQ